MESFDLNLAAFTQWLLKTTLQGGLLVCLIMLIKVILREKLSAQWHYGLWLVLLIRLALPWAPQSRFSIYNPILRSLPSYQVTSSLSAAPSGETDGKSDKPPQQSNVDRALATGQSETSSQMRRTDSGEKNRPATVATSDGLSSRTQGRGQQVAMFIARFLPWLWLVGGIILIVYILLRAVGLWRAVISERPVTDQQTLELLEDCKMQMRIRTLVGLVVTDKVTSPALFGFVRPRILLPDGLLETLSLDELRHVFLHELAHLKRCDIYVAWCICILQILHWFNPLIWFAFRRMRADQEIAADAMALKTAGTEESHRYGQTIVNLLERFARPQYLPSIAGILENPSYIERRIQMISKFKSEMHPWSALGIVVIVVLSAISMIDPIQGTTSASPAPEAKASTTMRLVQKEIEDQVSISPDGRYLCDCGTFVETGGITIRELATGEQRIIKPTKRTPEDTGPQYPVMSPDNKAIAYAVGRPKEGADGIIEADVCLIGIDGFGQRVVCPDAATRPVQWFPDSSRLLGLRWRVPKAAFNEIEIVSVSIPDGSVQLIKTLTGEFFGTTVRLSPDAKYIAYEMLSKDAPEKHDIFVVEIDSKQETLLVGHQADDRLLDWAPDGRQILFSSDRMGSWSTWLLPVAKGQAQGTPELVARNIGNIRPVGFTGNGSYYYRMKYGLSDIYMARIDVTTGQLLSAPAPLEAAGSNLGADWSPDGKYLAYCAEAAASSGSHVVRIRSLATGEERELLHKLPEFWCIRWSPDGGSLLASWLIAYKPEEVALTKRVYRIDAVTGDSTVLQEMENPGVQMTELSPDGKTLYYSRGGIFRRQLDTGQEKEIFAYPWKAQRSSWALSPNGEFIAAGCNEGTNESIWHQGGVKRVVLIPSQGGQATELLRWDEPTGYLTNFAWSRDGKTVLFTLHREPVTGKNLKRIDEFWQVTTDGSQPRKIMETDLSMSVPRGLRVHPDGQRITFSAATMHQELWLMENFLPSAIGVKESK